MLYRKIAGLIEKHLASGSNRLLIIDGARQVGKSYIIRWVGKRMFPNYIEINMEEDKLGGQIFAQARTVQDFYLALSVVAGTGIALLKEQGLVLPPELTAELKLYPRADSIITCAQVEAPVLVDPAEAEPLYCRNEVTWKKVSEQKHH